MDRTRTATARVVFGVLATLVVGAGTAALVWWRLGPVTRGTVWAEDGGVFLRDRVALGPVDSLLHPYAGYLHLVPRLLVDVGWAFPVEDYARAVSAGACVVVGVVAAVVFVLARDLVPSWPLRLLLAAVPALLPLAPYEIAGNAANLHWFMLFAAPWCFAHRSRTWWGSAAVAVLTAFVVLTELQAVLFLPLLLLAWFPLRDGAGARAWPRAVPVTAVALVAAGAQVVVALTDRRISEPGSPAFADVVGGWVLQPFAGAWDRDVAAAVRLVVAHGWAPVLVPLAALVLVVVGALLVGTWRARWMIVALAVASGGVWWAALLANAGAAQHWSHPVAALEAVPPQRYAAASGLLLLAAAVVSASVLIGWRAPMGADVQRVRTGGAVRVVGAVAGWCVVTLVVAAAVGNLGPGATRRSVGPVWADEIPAAAAACDGDRSRVVDVRTAPWSAEVPCARLLER
ncbi:hypothetical protein FHW23_002945 [Curtobacterium pusillum]|uniref:DUF2029 domain-containing protein n=1 Tax=Curtobacterium pusillum TaxID=69373 RepID=A0AAW3TB61_9MICO|nr:hypothetical protein [Curtobacterium pusillum]MBA8991667.1 hypothetical protein [Curtobacterium pusillum]